MGQKGHVEIEVKYRIPDLEPLRRLLADRGFRETHPQQEESSVLWDRDGGLRSQGCALRLRRYGDLALLTWKGPRQEDPRLKIRPEIETEVADPGALEGILGHLGFAPAMAMRKSRSIWRRGSLEACLDEAPFGRYLELEGSREEIAAAAAELGLRDEDVEPRSYPALFAEK